MTRRNLWGLVDKLQEQRMNNITQVIQDARAAGENPVNALRDYLDARNEGRRIPRDYVAWLVEQREHEEKQKEQTTET